MNRQIYPPILYHKKYEENIYISYILLVMYFKIALFTLYDTRPGFWKIYEAESNFYFLYFIGYLLRNNLMYIVWYTRISKNKEWRRGLFSQQFNISVFNATDAIIYDLLHQMYRLLKLYLWLKYPINCVK